MQNMTMLKHAVLVLAVASPCFAQPLRVFRTYVTEQVPFLNPPSPRFNYWEIRNQGGIISAIRLSHAPRHSDLSTVESIPQTDPPATRFAAWPTPDQAGRVSYRWFVVSPNGAAEYLQD